MRGTATDSEASPSAERVDGPETLEGLAGAVVRTIREPLLILDADLRVRAANPAFYRTFRTDPERTLGRSLFELSGGRWDVPALRQLLDDVLPRDTVVEDFELELDLETVGRRFMRLNARRLEQETESGERILLVLQDLTERRRMEDELRASNQELERFAYVASHDLQEPLRMVASYTELLARRYEGELDERADKYIGYAVDGAERMKALIQDLLEYSRVDTRGKPPEPTDAGEALDRVLEDLQLAISRTDARVTRDALPEVLADPVQLRQLFQNLIENAIKFSGDEPPVVHVSARRRSGECHFTVRDRGVGIEPEYLDEVFVIFKRLQGGKAAGTGIGLALCRKIVERHGGELWVESEPGEGSAFHFTLPSEDAP